MHTRTKSIMVKSKFLYVVAVSATTLLLSLSLTFPASGETVTDTTGPTDSPNSTIGKQQTKFSSNMGASAVTDMNATDSKASTKNPKHVSKKMVKRGRKPSGYGEPGNISTVPDKKTTH